MNRRVISDVFGGRRVGGGEGVERMSWWWNVTK